MRKNLMITCIAIAAFAAFVVAPVASASPVLTSEGKAVALGTEIKGSNTGVFKFENGFYTIQCTQVTLFAKVVENGGTKVKLEAAPGGFVSTGTGAGADCTSNWAPTTLSWGKVCLETTTGTDKVLITGCGASLVMTTNITNFAICKYTSATWAGSFVTNADATLLIASQPLTKAEGSGSFCPSEAQFSFDMDFTTTNGATLSIS